MLRVDAVWLHVGLRVRLLMGSQFGGPAFVCESPRTPSANHRSVTSRFPAPWRIVEIPNGFAVDDATGQQLGVFYGRADPNTAGHTGFLTIDEARQMAADFARLPELLERSSGSHLLRERRTSARNRVANARRRGDPKATRTPI